MLFLAVNGDTVPFRPYLKEKFDVHPPETAPLATLTVPLTGATSAHVIAAGTSRWGREEIPIFAMVTVANAAIFRNKQHATDRSATRDVIIDARELWFVYLTSYRRRLEKE